MVWAWSLVGGSARGHVVPMSHGKRSYASSRSSGSDDGLPDEHQYGWEDPAHREEERVCEV